jgi:LAO/AO transport system kinase
MTLPAALSIDALAAGVRAGQRAMLARAITLVESTHPRHRDDARALLANLAPDTGRAHRIGLTGVPGVGKSTTIDQLGMNLIAAGHRVAVLAVDPTSSRTGGSILGDKTRMSRLAQADGAFIRPSPTSGTLGGVARKTRETMALCEAAGFDIVIVETVGVGQSETTVADMVDVFVVLLLAGGGDDLQGIKKGIIELADIVAINKADGDNRARATRAAADYQAALHILTPATATWSPPVLTLSGLTNDGLDRLWATIGEHRTRMTAAGLLQQRRADQAVRWMQALVEDALLGRLLEDPRVIEARATLEAEVRAGRLTAQAGALRLIDLLTTR